MSLDPAPRPEQAETVSEPPAQSDKVTQYPSGEETQREKRTSAGETGIHVPGYEIQEVLGRGGMGVVYKARHVKLDRVVALKMILAGGHATADELARFKIEAEAVARLQHPNIVQIFEVGEWQTGAAGPALPYFSLEYCGGGSLAKKIDGTPQQPLETARIVEQLARAMHAAHEKNIIPAI